MKSTSNIRLNEVYCIFSKNFLKLVLKHILEISIVLVTFEIIFFQIFFILVPVRQGTHTPTYFAELRYAKINNYDNEKYKFRS